MRTKKTVDGWDYNYYYSDGKLVRQTWADGEMIDFLYDESGLAYSFIYNGTQYYYVKNLQGDVIAIVDEYGNMAAEYTYDAWGNVLYTNEYTHDNIGYVNPIRYRSYYQDTETGFYYLQTRYYDPAIRRFINADGYVNANGDILGFNMYAYCSNNPVMNVDYSGECYFDSNGNWSHDNWEYTGGYIRQPAPTNIVDITEKLNNAMRENAEILSEYKEKNGYFDTVNFFIDKVKPNGDWDFKSQDEWALNSNTLYLYNGMLLRYDDIGNIHYGYIGRVIFEDDMLLMAGGIVQIYTKTSKWSYYNTNFDDPRDQWAIRVGINLWDKRSKK